MAHPFRSPTWFAILIAFSLLASTGTLAEDDAGGSTSLQAQLDAMIAKASEGAPPEMMATYEAAIEEIARQVALDEAINTGDRAPDFTLPNALGEEVELSSLLKQGPVILTWYRGSWCPFCNLQLHAYQQVLPQIQAAGAQLVAVSPEVPDEALSFKEKEDLQFEVLSDQGNAVARNYGVVYDLPPQIREQYSGAGRVNLIEHNADDSLTLPLAVTYVIDTNGIVTYAFVATDYRTRAEPAVLVEEVQKLQPQGRSE